jgi:hypothetical protein
MSEIEFWGESTDINRMKLTDHYFRQNSDASYQINYRNLGQKNRYKIGTEIQFNKKENIQKYCKYGLYNPDSTGYSWSAGKYTEFEFLLDKIPDSNLSFKMSGFIYGYKGYQQIKVYANDEFIGHMVLSRNDFAGSIIIPKNILRDNTISIKLEFVDAMIPHAIDDSDSDLRILAFAFDSISVNLTEEEPFYSQTLIMDHPRDYLVDVIDLSDNSVTEDMLTGMWENPEASSRGIGNDVGFYVYASNEYPLAVDLWGWALQRDDVGKFDVYVNDKRLCRLPDLEPGHNRMIIPIAFLQEGASYQKVSFRLADDTEQNSSPIMISRIHIYEQRDYNNTILFNPSIDTDILSGDWYLPEEYHIWTGREASFRFYAGNNNALNMIINGGSFGWSGDSELYVNDIKIANLPNQPDGEWTANIPPYVLCQDGVQEAKIVSTAAISAKEAEVSDDDRVLGVYLRSAILTSVQSAEVLEQSLDLAQLDFTENDGIGLTLFGDWYSAEEYHRWAGKTAGFKFFADAKKPYTMKIDGGNYGLSGQTEVWVNGLFVTALDHQDDGIWVTTIPAYVLNDRREQIVEFRTPYAVSPAQVAGEASEQLLGVFVRAISINPEEFQVITATP